jgi:hypothetical protein
MNGCNRGSTLAIVIATTVLGASPSGWASRGANPESRIDGSDDREFAAQQKAVLT